MMKFPDIKNLNPQIWGPYGWRFFHAVALTYPDNPSDANKKAAGNFFNSLQYLLPCEQCRVNYHDELEAMPVEPHLGDKQSLNNWLVKVHNSVSHRLDKPMLSSVEDVMDYIMSVKNGKDEFARMNVATPISTCGKFSKEAIITTTCLGAVCMALLMGVIVLSLRIKK